MTRTTKSLLIISVVCLLAGMAFVTGLINVEKASGLYVALPFGAIFFGLFLLSKMLEKESAHYDAEQRALASAAERAVALTASRQSRRPTHEELRLVKSH